VTVQDVIHLAIIGIIALTLADRCRTLRARPHDLAVRSMFLALVYLEIVFLLGFPPFYRAAYRLLGQVPSLPQLLQHAATMAMAHYIGLFALAVLNPEQPLADRRRALRRRRVVLLAFLGVLVLAYLLGPWRLRLTAVAGDGTRDATVLAYVVVTQTYPAVVLSGLIWLWWTNREIAHAYLRAALRFIAAGSVFGLLFIIHKIGYFVTTTFGVTLPWRENGPTGLQALLLGPAVLCIVVGSSVPYLGQRLVRRYRRRRWYRQLQPLVAAVRQAPPNPGGRPRDADSRLLGAVVDIRDALIGPLQPFLRRDVYDISLRRSTAAGAPDAQARAIAEATCIAAALHRPQRDASVVPPPFNLADDLDAEAAWLARVSQAYVTADEVRELRGAG
jgi:hypothetical protein